jgi:hypothetical protein
LRLFDIRSALFLGVALNIRGNSGSKDTMVRKMLKDFILIMTYDAFRTYIYLFFHVVAMFLNAFLESGDELLDACV